MKSQFDAHMWDESLCPDVEDLISHPTFRVYDAWLKCGGDKKSCYKGLTHADDHASRLTNAIGLQRSTRFRKGAIKEFVPLELGEETHFALAKSLAESDIFPFDEVPPLEADIFYAKEDNIENVDALHSWRTVRLYGIKALSEDLQPLSTHLRSFQGENARHVTSKVHIALLAAMVTLMQWPDRQIAYCFVIGFPTVGLIPASGVYPTRGNEDAPSKDHLIRTAPAYIEKVERELSTPSKWSKEIFEGTQKEMDKGFCSPLFAKEQLDQLFPQGPPHSCLYSAI